MKSASGVAASKTEKRLVRYRGLLVTCDELIRTGQIGRAQKYLLDIRPGQIPRPLLADVAKLCRRAGLNNLGARLLYPVIRSDRRKHGPPTDAEISEYATLISRLGYTGQALKMLEQVHPDRHPEALLLRGYCYVSLWDYAAAAPLFARYLTYPLDSYARLIAQINMAAALIETGRPEEARAILREAMTTARSSNARRLLANGYEMSGRIHMAAGLWSHAEEDFRMAEELLGQSQSLDQLLIEKNLAWIQARKTSSLAPLTAFRRLAIERRHWDSVREADRLSLSIEFRPAVFDRLVIGSPRAAYRQRVLEEFNRSPSSHFILGETKGRVLDLESGAIDHEPALKPGQMIHRLLAILAADFYAPRSTGEIFSSLYPGELYDVNHSSFRVAQVIHRLRAWLKELSFPIEISQENGFYQLQIHPGGSVRVPGSIETISALGGAWTRIQHQFSDDDRFTTADICERLQISRSQAHRWLRELVKDGRLDAYGEGRATFYRVAAPERKIA